MLPLIYLKTKRVIIMEKLKNLVIGIVAVVVLVYGAISLIGNDSQHIEDTNGADNYSLQQITDKNIIKMDMGARNFAETKSVLSSMREYSSKKFTGVAEAYRANIVSNRFDITLYNTNVKEGNLRIVLVYNDEIVHEFDLNELSQSYTLDNPKGTVSLRVAGESANFNFSYDLI